MNVDYMKYFPYENLRKNQKVMLDAVSNAIENKSTLMISAPTGTGKSSVVIPAIAYAKTHNKKVIVATRTKTQIGIFVNELERVRSSKFPNLKYSFLLGKSEMCPIYKQSKRLTGKDAESQEQKEKADRLYKLCSELKQQSNSKDKNDADEDIGCFYYHNVYDKKLLLPEAYNVAKYIMSNRIEPESYLSVVDPSMCPYELLLIAAREADVVIVNYKHVFDTDIRTALYKSLGVEPSDVILIADEAHNVSSSVCESLTVTITEKNIDGIIDKVHDRTSMGELIVKEFKENLHKASERLISNEIKKRPGEKQYETVLDLAEMANTGVIDTAKISTVLASMVDYEKKMASGNNMEYKSGNIEELLTFITKLSHTSRDFSYIGVVSYSSGDYSYEIRNINPARTMNEIRDEHHSLILISGTLSPMDSYRVSLFGKDSDDVQCLELDNIFPEQNRKLYIANDYSSKMKNRSDKNNIRISMQYISKLCERDGNVAIFFASYGERNKYLKLINENPSIINGKEIFIEPNDPKNPGAAYKLLKEFMELPEQNRSGIMLASAGGKWSEGIDYKGDKLVGAMILGFPLAPFSTVQIAINNRFKGFYGKSGDFISYTLPALNKSMQALGRVIRTETDKGLLILADERFDMYRRSLPVWVNAEAKIVNAGKINEIITRF